MRNCTIECTNTDICFSREVHRDRRPRQSSGPLGELGPWWWHQSAQPLGDCYAAAVRTAPRAPPQHLGISRLLPTVHVQSAGRQQHRGASELTALLSPGRRVHDASWRPDLQPELGLDGRFHGARDPPPDRWCHGRRAGVYDSRNEAYPGQSPQARLVRGAPPQDELERRRRLASGDVGEGGDEGRGGCCGDRVVERMVDSASIFVRLRIYFATQSKGEEEKNSV